MSPNYQPVCNVAPEEDIYRYIDDQSIALAKTEFTFAVPHHLVSYNEAVVYNYGGGSC